MEAYKVRPHVWIIIWNGHEIRFEYLKKTTVPRQKQSLIFFNGKELYTRHNNDDEITAIARTDEGVEYNIYCGVYRKTFYPFQDFWWKSVWQRIKDYIDVTFSTFNLYASFMINDDLIYLSDVGYKDAIEWESIQDSWKLLKKEQDALLKGYILTRDIQRGYGVCKERIFGNDLEKEKMRIADQKAKIESRVKDWSNKWGKKDCMFSANVFS